MLAATADGVIKPLSGLGISVKESVEAIGRPIIEAWDRRVSLQQAQTGKIISKIAEGFATVIEAAWYQRRISGYYGSLGEAELQEYEKKAKEVYREVSIHLFEVDPMVDEGITKSTDTDKGGQPGKDLEMLNVEDAGGVTQVDL